jgi:hypothetical protein
MIVGFLSVITLNLQCFWGDSVSNSDKWVNFFGAMGIDILIGGTAFMVGGGIGFLFGIPRVVNSQSAQQNAKTQILQNDNLLQVSDWLTKIIIGVGLTQLIKAPHHLGTLSVKISELIQLKGNASNAIVIASILVFYSSAGIATCYLWTRVYFTRLLKMENSATDGDGQANEDKPLIKKKNKK